MELTRRSLFLLLLTAAPVRAGVVVPRQHASLWRGLRFGAKEASHTASLLARSFVLVEAEDAVTIRGPLVTITANKQTYRLSPAEKGKVAWHPKLVRYGAGELNERFLRQTKHPMDEAAYLGWLAIKIVAEAGFRGQAIEKVRVDGHKGVALKFDASRNLVQPLYEVPK